MASPLAGRALQLACRRGFASGSARQISTTTSTQDSWFSRLFKGSTTETTVPEQAEPGQTNQNRSPSTPEATESRLESPGRTHRQDTPTRYSPQPTQTAGTTTSAPAAVQRRKRNRRISFLAENADDKHRLFDEHVSFMEPRLGRSPQLSRPFIRKSTWIRTLALCQTEEQLKKVMKMVPMWRDMGHAFDTTFSHAFIRRCLYLDKPELALELFGDFGKYNVPLTLDGVRELLNATYDKQSIGFVVTLTRLFNVYKLGPVRNDYSSCAMVIAACLKNRRKDAMVLADALLPHLKTRVEKTGPLPLQKGQEVGQKLPLVWGIHAMKKVEKRLPAGIAKENSWLPGWRVESGHIQGHARV